MHATPAWASSGTHDKAPTSAEAGQASSSGQEAGTKAAEEGKPASDPHGGQSQETSNADFFSQLRTSFSKAAGRLHGSGVTRASLGEGVRRAAVTVSREVREALLAAPASVSATRAYDGPVMEATQAGDGPSAISVVQQQETRWQKAWNAARDKLGQNPLLSRLSSLRMGENAAVKKGREAAEALRERWETSDHPVVHSVEGMKERVFAESGAAAALREIRSRDAAFDMSRFIYNVKVDAPVVVKAFLTHDLEVLRRHCGPELMERLTGIFKHFETQGLYEDPTLLFVGEVELVEVQLVDGDPLVVLQFSCQQLKCTRDKFGNVVDGAEDAIQRVFYFWGVQQEKTGLVTAEGKLLPPRWVIKDMMWQSMLTLV